ncbi:unnamed protein product [Durusdinium trenchii]|uniref:Non-specific serine/threonine protein kinase n=1 Tax=Durusdinium trenchii TaxID=1381693 RepID=A0ABP0PZ37_9DINO
MRSSASQGEPRKKCFWWLKATPRLSVQPESGPPEEVKQRSQLDLHLIDGHLRGLAPAGADKADIWAVGALAFRLLTGVPPFCPPEGSKKEIVGMMQTEPIKFSKKDWSKRSSKCLDAIQCMLRVTSSLRPTAAELLRHPWLKLAREPVPLVRMHRLFANGLNYLKESQFKKLIIRVIAQQMPENEPHIEQANGVFRALDRDRDGLLSPAEFMEGLYLFPDLLQRMGEDPERLFEAADRDGSGFLDSREFAACTLPPAKAREEEVIWYAFRAFDEADDVTIEKVLLMARLLEGQLISREQIEELITVLQSELSRIRVPLKLERPTLETEAEASESSGVSERLQMEGESDDEDDESLQDGAVPRVSMGSRPTISGNSSMMGSGRLPPRLPPNKEKEKSKEGFMQRKWQGLVEKTRRWVTRPRPLDFGEFVFLCDTRRKGVGPGKLLYRVARKELFRIFLKHDLDFYEVVHKVPDFDWPPKAGDVARTPNSCHFATGGLYSKQQQAGDNTTQGDDADE